MNTRNQKENPFFTIKSPEEYRQLAIALSYARGRLSDKVKAEKLERYKLIKGSITEQLIKREALRQIAEFDNFLNKDILNELLENNEAVEQQQVNANVVEIAPVNGYVPPPPPPPPAPPVQEEEPAPVQEEEPAPVQEEEPAPPVQEEGVEGERKEGDDEEPAPKVNVKFKIKKPVQEEGVDERKEGEEEQELEPIVIKFNNLVLEGNRAIQKKLAEQRKYAKNAKSESIKKRISNYKQLKNKNGLSAGAEQFLDKNIVILENVLKLRLDGDPLTNPELISFIRSKGFELYVNAQVLKKPDSKIIYEMIMEGATRPEVREAINLVYTRKTGKKPKTRFKGFGLEKTNKIQLMVGSAMAGNNNKKLLRKIR